MNGIKKYLPRIVLGFFAALVLLYGILQLVLTPDIIHKAVDRYYPRFIDAELSFSEARVSLFRHFPNISLCLDDASLTYPSDRYAQQENIDYQAVLMQMGRNTEACADTLASFRRFNASLSLGALLKGEIKLNSIELDRPRIFAKYYNDSTYNWNIFKSSDEEDEEEASSGLPDIVLGSVALSGHPRIIFSSPQDTLFAMLDIKRLELEGKLPLQRLQKMKATLDVDSVNIAGRYASDTLLFSMYSIHMRKHPKTFNARVSADAYAATQSYGRLRIPLSLRTSANFPHRNLKEVEIENLDAEIAHIPLSAFGHLKFNDKDIEVSGQMETDEFSLATLLDEYGPNLWDGFRDAGTDARLSLLLLCEGAYNPETGALPELAAELWIPKSSFHYYPRDLKADLEMRLDLQNTSEGELYAELKKFTFKGEGLDLNFSGTGENVLGDGRFRLNGKLGAVLDQLVAVLPEDSGVKASGKLIAELTGDIRSWQFNKDNIARADLLADIYTDSISASVMNDSIRLNLGKSSLKVNTLGSRQDSTVARGQRLVALEASLANLQAAYKDSLNVKSRNVAVSAQSSADIMDSSRKLGFYPVDGRFTADVISLMDADSGIFIIRRTDDSFKIKSKKGHPETPVLSVNSNNGGFFLKDRINRLGLRGVRFNANAEMTEFERQQRMKKYLDSVARYYPGVSRDSLRVIVRENFRAKRQMAEAGKDAGMDLSLDFGETVRSYYRNWNVAGNLAMDKVLLITPYFPIQTAVYDLKGDFTNDGVNVDNLTLVSGESKLTAKGSMSNLRRAMSKRGKLKFSLDLDSDHINMDELLGAYAVGSQFIKDEADASMMTMSDEEYQAYVNRDTLDQISLEDQLVVIPGNVELDLKLNAYDIDFSKLNIQWMASDMMVRDHCLQLTNTVASSNMGDIYFEGFYSTKSRQDVAAGFFINFVDITAEKVIEIVPSVDTLVPLLKAFRGMLDCEMAATARLDSCMNIIMPSVNGVVTVSGKDMEFIQTDEFTKIARTLMFRSKKGAFIENMSVQALISDNVMEVFPFALEMDRYKLAMSGEQQLDLPYRYHVSVLKSPIPFRLGIDISGPDFDHMKFKIGKAKYKSTNVPAFTTVINQAKMSLTSAIHNIFNTGADEVLRVNSEQRAINDWKKSSNYVAAVDMAMDTLSLKEKMGLDSLKVTQDSIQLQKIENATIKTNE